MLRIRWVAVATVVVTAAVVVSTAGPPAEAIGYRRTGLAVRLVSVDESGVEGNLGVHHAPSIALSADGRYVAFTSSATNLVTGDTNGRSDAFVRDRTSLTTTRVSTSAAGVEANETTYEAVISANGTVVAFVSEATNLVPADLTTYEKVYAKTLATGAVDRVAVSTAGVAANHHTLRPVISSDGRFVGFQAWATNLVANDLNNRIDVFVRDRVARTTERVSVSTAGAEGNEHSFPGGISADGRYVAYESTSSNLVPGDTNGYDDVFVRDRGSGATTRVSVSDAGAQGNSFSDEPAISADGRFVAFTSSATNLVASPSVNVSHVYVRDRTINQTDRVSVRADGTTPNSHSGTPAISADGWTIAFKSGGRNLVPVTTPWSQVYVQGRGHGPNPNCDFGESSIVCELIYNDAVGPVTIRWYADDVHNPSLDNQSVAVHPCAPGVDIRIRVRVSDANGPIEAGETLPCLTDRS